ncbi:MAG: glycosyltransferase family 4 protein [Caldilineaceae bacterium]|nr:glycosyltransferase family 4 protein [Caldilineaceae bacterium]
MNIAFICQPWDEAVAPVRAGSIPIVTYQLARRLAPAAAVTVFAKRGAEQPAVDQDEHGISYRRFCVARAEQTLRPLRLADRMLAQVGHAEPLFGTALFYRDFGQRVARQLAETQPPSTPTVVHIHNFSQFVPVVRAAMPRAKIVLHMHCEWLTQLKPRTVARRLAETDLVLGVSDYLTDKIRARFPAQALKCHTLVNGVDVPAFRPAHDAADTVPAADGPRLLFVGRVSPEKGVHTLLAAFGQVAARYPTARLDIVGPLGETPYEYIVRVADDPHVAELAAFYDGRLRHRAGSYQRRLDAAIRPELADRVHFHGAVSHGDVARFYRAATLLVNPSLSEAFGMSVIEAMAGGLPVVTTRVGGMTEVVADGEVGRLVPPNDADALAATLVDLLADRDAHTAMRAAGPAHAARYDWDAVTATLAGHYARLLDT